MGGPTVIHGIKACDTMKTARAWLDDHAVEHLFHDYKTAGIDPGQLRRWSRHVGWETLLNRAGTTFRRLPEHSKRDLDEDKAVALMTAQPSMIKRPVLQVGEQVIVGFRPETYAAVFGV